VRSLRRLFKGSSGIVKFTRGLGQVGYGLPKRGWIVVAWKEFLEAIRDRRTILNVIILPLILMPLIIALPIVMISPRTLPPKVMVVICDKNATDLVNYFNSISKEADLSIKFDCKGNYTEMILNGNIDLVVEVPPGFSENLSRGRSSQVFYYYDPLSTKSSSAIGVVQEPISSYSRKVLLDRLKEVNLSIDYVNPVVAVAKQVTRSGGEVGAGEMITAMILPMMVGVIAVTGAGTFAIDMVAGERERRTIEALLTNPVSKMEILLGKFSSLIVLSIISGLSTLLSTLLGITLSLELSLPGLVSNQAMKMGLPNPVYAILGILLTVVLGGLTGNAVLVAASSFAKTFKEAEQYVGALFFVLMLPMMIVPYAPTSLHPLLRLLPITSLAMFARDTILMSDLLAISTSLFSSLIYLIIFLILSAKLFGRESVIFG
jgi:ABC-type Na+ efflux pump permease subunit